MLLRLWLAANGISAKTSRINIAKSFLMKMFVPWSAAWFFRISTEVTLYLSSSRSLTNRMNN